MLAFYINDSSITMWLLKFGTFQYLPSKLLIAVHIFFQIVELIPDSVIDGIEDGGFDSFKDSSGTLLV